MDDKRLEEIKQRLADASRGPWEWREDEPGSLVIPNPGFHPTNILKCTDDWRPRPNDANFIAHARQDIQDLVAEVEVLREVNEINQQTLEVIVNKMHN